MGQNSWPQLEFNHYQLTYYPIQNSQIKESSGLACSRRSRSVLWTHNDSGHMPIIYALSDSGEDLGTYFLEGVNSRDWEDMAAFSLNGRPYILVADSGDNFEIFQTYTLSIFKEPDLNRRSSSALSPQWQVNYRFADYKSYDVEAVAVDVQRHSVLLLSKRTPNALMFEVPLQMAEGEQIVTAEQVGELVDIIHPTAMDMTADGETLIILTYGYIHFFERLNKPQGDNKVKYRKIKQPIEYKKLFQPEALCLSSNEKEIFVTSERKTRLLKIQAQQDMK